MEMQKSQKNYYENYYVGLDIGTDSVGYAVTDENYRLIKHNGEPMWGVTLFEEGTLGDKRRAARTARRRLDRRQQRVRLVEELLAPYIIETDEGFFRRIHESYLIRDDASDSYLLGTLSATKDYYKKYPTIHHLICALMNGETEADARLLHIACAWLVAHRGHFLSEVDKDKIEDVTDFHRVYEDFVTFFSNLGYPVPWDAEAAESDMETVLKLQIGVGKKAKILKDTLCGKNKITTSEEGTFSWEHALKLVCGCKVSLKDLFNNDSYEDLETKSFTLDSDEETIAQVIASVDENGEIIEKLKSLYDWSVLVEALKGKHTISEGKIEVYNQHKRDLATLKRFVKKYCIEIRYAEICALKGEDIKKFIDSLGNGDVIYDELIKSYGWITIINALVGKTEIDKKYVEKLDILRGLIAKKVYSDVFCAFNKPANYVAYSYYSKKAKHEGTKANVTVFTDYVKKLFKDVTPDDEDRELFDDMMSRLETESFMPKQKNGDNRVIPYQLYMYELRKILENNVDKFPFLAEKDSDGISLSDKLLAVFEFRVPYYVGPLRNDENNKNAWVVRKQGRIYPWNFNKMVDIDQTEEEFINKMLNRCTYLHGEDVLPKCSLLYSSYTVLNEINNIKINDEPISVELKQLIYIDVFMQNDKVTLKRIKDYLYANGKIGKDDTLSGIDDILTSSLKSYRVFRRLTESGVLSYSEVEEIIKRSTYVEDRRRFEKWLSEHYSKLTAEDVKYVCSLKFKDFGRLSKRLLCDIFGAPDPETGEARSIIRAMWETNCNINQLILTDNYSYKAQIEEISRDYYSKKTLSLNDRLDEMYISNAVKRPIIRTLDILKDVVKIMGHEPSAVFVEMARGASEEQKGKRTKSRQQQIREFYEKLDTEDVRLLTQTLDSLGEDADTKLQSDKIFLYFMQLGKCMYTGERISFESILKGDGRYNIDHIFPRCTVTDESIINNKVLVTSESNGVKGDSYPIDASVRERMIGLWTYLNNTSRSDGTKLMSDEKFKRLKRNHGFTDEELHGFIQRQLVETRQSTKAVTTLLKEMYTDTEICYVKAGLVSDFRHQFSMLKSRAVNDLHHAKDAYLNIVCGNVYYSYFNKNYFRLDRGAKSYNIKPEIMFSRAVYCGKHQVWDGADSVAAVRKVISKNNAHVTVYQLCRHSGQNGGFFDQNPLKAAPGLIPLKKGMPTEQYGGYNKATASFFVLVRYKIAKKQDIMIMPVELLFADKFLASNDYADEYAKNTVSSIVGKDVESVEILLNRRIIKVKTVFSLDGFMVCLAGKSDGGKKIGITPLSQLKETADVEYYVKRLESFAKKKSENENIVFSELYDGITQDKNAQLYDLFITKFSKWPYSKRPANPKDILVKGRDKFVSLSTPEQASVLLQILGLLGRINKADLKDIGGSASTGVATLSSSLSNWTKNYTDVRIIDSSASGLYESRSENLLDLLK